MVASVALWADDTLRSHGTPYLEQAALIFSQWGVSVADPMITTALARGFLFSNYNIQHEEETFQIVSTSRV